MAGPLIAVWSPKGGAGCTLIASGLAMHLARRSEQPVLLADLHPENPNIAALLQLPLRPNIFDYLSGTGQAALHPSGVQVLSGPHRLADEGLITAELTEAVLNRALSEGHAVVADVSPALRDSTVIALEQATAVLLVTTPDLLSIYACRRFTQEAEMIGLSLRNYRLVMNRTTERQAIPEAEIADLIGLEPAGAIPSLPDLAAAVNCGTVTSRFWSNIDFAVALHRVADSLGFAGVVETPAATVTRPLENARPTGMVDAVRNWWRSL